MVCVEVLVGFLLCYSSSDLTQQYPSSWNIEEVLFADQINWSDVTAKFGNESLPRIKCLNSPVVCIGDPPENTLVDCDCVSPPSAPHDNTKIDITELTETERAEIVTSTLGQIAAVLHDEFPPTTESNPMNEANITNNEVNWSTTETTELNTTVSNNTTTEAVTYPTVISSPVSQSSTPSSIVNITWDVEYFDKSSSGTGTSSSNWHHVSKAISGTWTMSIIGFSTGILVALQLGCLIWCIKTKRYQGKCVTVSISLYFFAASLFSSLYLFTQVRNCCRRCICKKYPATARTRRDRANLIEEAEEADENPNPPPPPPAAVNDGNVNQGPSISAAIIHECPPRLHSLINSSAAFNWGARLPQGRSMAGQDSGTKASLSPFRRTTRAIDKARRSQVPSNPPLRSAPVISEQVATNDFSAVASKVAGIQDNQVTFSQIMGTVFI